MVRGLSWEEVTVPFPRVERCDEVHLAAEMDGIGLRWQRLQKRVPPFAAVSAQCAWRCTCERPVVFALPDEPALVPGVALV